MAVLGKILRNIVGVVQGHVAVMDLLKVIDRLNYKKLTTLFDVSCSVHFLV